MSSGKSLSIIAVLAWAAAAPPAVAHGAEEPDMTRVNPGKDDRIVWNFDGPGEFQFACIVAGHYQAGMAGAISVTPSRKSTRRK